MPKEEYEIQIRDIVKRYKEVLALDHFSLNVKKGEIYGLLGPNGSGKSTLINCMLDLLKYEKGEVIIFGKKMSPFAYDVKRQIGLVPQDVSVYNELNVRENIDYFCSLYIDDAEERKKKVDRAIEFVRLEEFQKMRPKKLSGGLLRRLNLACGIAHEPRLIILDEPTVAVDPQSRSSILEGIKELSRNGATVIYTTHYMEEVEMICDRLSIMDRGRMLVEGTSEEIIELSSVGEQIEIICYDMPDELLEKLRQNASVINLDYKDGELKLTMKRGKSRLLDILHEFDEAGLKAYSVNSKRPSLNDVFLEITGKELRDHEQ